MKMLPQDYKESKLNPTEFPNVLYQKSYKESKLTPTEFPNVLYQKSYKELKLNPTKIPNYPYLEVPHCDCCSGYMDKVPIFDIKDYTEEEADQITFPSNCWITEIDYRLCPILMQSFHKRGAWIKIRDWSFWAAYNYKRASEFLDMKSMLEYQLKFTDNIKEIINLSKNINWETAPAWYLYRFQQLEIYFQRGAFLRDGMIAGLTLKSFLNKLKEKKLYPSNKKLSLKEINILKTAKPQYNFNEL
jgi:hypothetical protein